MEHMTKLQSDVALSRGDERYLRSFDGLTKSIALSLTRRGFIRSAIVGLGATLGMAIFNVGPVSAQVSCNFCDGPCSWCSSYTGVCCSPNGQYCYACTATCQICYTCGKFKAREAVCNDGGHGCSVIRC